MSVTFNGTKPDPSVPWGTRIVRTRDEQREDSVGLNFANANARLFLRLLEVPGAENDELYGSLSIREAVRLVQCARASFDYRVDVLCRRAEEGRGANGCRYFSAGVDAAYFERRLTEFADYLADWIELGATGISWG